MKKVLFNQANQGRTLHLNRVFAERDADQLIARIFELNQSEGEIFLQINSPGGSAAGAIKLYDNLVLSPNPVIGVVIGDCFSMASIILQACRNRYASEHSRMHIHHVTNPVNLTLRHYDTIRSLEKELLADIALAQKNDKISIDILEKKLKISREKIIKIMDEDKPITTAQALEIGLIDEIIK